MKVSSFFEVTSGILLFRGMLQFDDSDNTKLTFGFKSIILIGLAEKSSFFLFPLNITLDRVNFGACGLLIGGGSGSAVGGLFIDGDSDNEEECDEKSLFFEDEVKSKLPVASLILLKLRVLRLLFVLTDMFCDHAPFYFYM